MFQLPGMLRSARLSMGMTQSELARSAGVSLPTIQAIEAGRANPSLATLESVLRALGLGLGIEEQPADWDALCALGLPLTTRRRRKVVPGRDLLVAHVRLAAREISRDGPEPGRERRTEALHALLLALEHHFPSVFRSSLAGSPPVRAILERPVTGRVVKLERIALAALAEYL